MKRGFTLVEIMIVVAIIALLAAIAIPNLLRARMTANEAAAQATLKTISTAEETFAGANNGSYAVDEDALTGAVPPYLNRPYCTLTISGYTYNCTMDANGYTVVAVAANPTVSGNNDYTITVGGVLTSSAL